MWGRFYWGRKEEASVGVVVVFSWASSDERHLREFVELYGSLGWNSLVCHADLLTNYFREKATSLAQGLFEELAKELKIRSLPVIFASFSDGVKTCMYKFLKVIEEKSGSEFGVCDAQLVRDCVCGHIYDSSPIDFASDLGSGFLINPTSPTLRQPPRLVSRMARAIASGFDSLFPNRFEAREAQCADYWQTMLSSVTHGPFLLLCSKDDQLAPCSVICNFAERLQELGGDVKVLKWNSSPHLGHYKFHRDDYLAAVNEFLGRAVLLYHERTKLHGEGAIVRDCNQNMESDARPSDYFLPGSLDYLEGKGGSPVHDEQKGALFDTENPPGIDTHGVLGKILFDTCVPKNIEGWDIKPSAARQTYGFNHGYGRFNPTKLIRRSRL